MILKKFDTKSIEYIKALDARSGTWSTMS